MVHFEMPYEDRSGSQRFMGRHSGGRPRCSRRGHGEYVGRRPQKPTKTAPILTAGFSRKDPIGPDNIRSVVIAVDNLQASIRKVTDAGGHVLGDPMEIPGVGQYVSRSSTPRQPRQSDPAHPASLACAEGGVRGFVVETSLKSMLSYASLYKNREGHCHLNGWGGKMSPTAHVFTATIMI